MHCSKGLFIHTFMYKSKATKINNECLCFNYSSFLFIIFFLVLILAQESPRLVFVKSAGLGDTVTLHCEVKRTDINYLYWFKQSPGYFSEIVASIVFESITVKPHFDLRFTVAEGASDCNLIIRNVTKGDEANYFCRQYTLDSWVNCTFLSVKGKMNPFQCLH